jgi:hypothetical protein
MRVKPMCHLNPVYCHRAPLIKIFVAWRIRHFQSVLVVFTVDGGLE